MLPITDTHQHLWDLRRQKLPWLSGVPALNRDHSIRDYLLATQGQGIHRSVYVEVDVEPAERPLEIDIVAEICAKPNLPTKAIVASLDPLSEDFDALLKQFSAARYVRGVRRVLHTEQTPPGHCLQKKFVEGVKKLGNAGLSFDLCMRSGELSDAAQLAKQCPGTQFIVDHCGNPDPVGVEQFAADSAQRDAPEFSHIREWAQGMQRLAALPNTVCKLSGIIASLPPNVDPASLGTTLNHCIEWFGTERVMFGSDWPVCTLRASLGEWVAAARRIIASRSLADQGRILDENAVRVYRLD